MTVSLLFALYLLISVLLIGIALIVIVKNYQSVINRIFFCFSIFVVAWIISNYFSNDFDISKQAALVANHFVLFFSGCAVIALTQFITRFTRSGWAFKNQNKIFWLSVIAVAPTLTGLVVKGIERQDQVYAINFGPAAYVYFVVLAFNIVLLSASLITSLKRSKGQERARLLIIMWSIILFLLFAFGLNALLPLLTGSFELTNIGPLFSSIVVIGMSYAIAKHKLFDIRIVVARSLAYIFSIASLAVLYGVFAFSIINFLIPADSSEFSRQIIYTLIAVALALTFPSIKAFFNKLSKTIFYRDAYDSQDLLNKLNSFLVGTINIEKLLTGSSEIIAETLKTEFCLFAINDQSKKNKRILGTVANPLSKLDLDDVLLNATVSKGKVIVKDDLDQSQTKLKNILIKNEVSLLVKLGDNSKTNKSDVGYMILGNKKTGSIYTKQDIRLLEIISKELVIAIQNALRFEEIEYFNVTLQEKVDDATKQLRKANNRLIELDQTKDDFISMASHQLRTPLTSVKGYSSMVMDGDAGKVSKKQNELLDQAFVSAQRMVYLIADLLNVSRLRTGKFVVELKESNLADVIEGEIAQLKETAKGHNLELVYKKPNKFPNLMLDETKMRQVIMNFADNAIYYTPSGGHINVTLEDKGERYEFTVSDDGIGVPKAEQHHLFNKFYRAGNAKKARPDGTGLGLFMAKKVVVAQGGSIIFSSQEGKGSTFGFSFAKKQLLPENYKGVVHEPEKVLS